jgi:lipopolysaccharide export system permease protein
MKKLDRYILGRFLTTFFFCIALFTMVVVVVDLSEKADDFARIHFTTWQIITQYYVGFIPHIDALLFPLFVFLSVIFFTSKMADRSEVVAILSSGVSFRRYLRPYWIGGIFLTAMLWFGYQSVLPAANTIWGNFLSKYIDSNAQNAADNAHINNIYFKTDSSTYAEIRSYDTTLKTGYYFSMQQFRNNKMVYDLRSQNLVWDSTLRDWKLNSVMERFITGDEQRLIHSAALVKNYNFKPSDIRSDDYFKDRLTTSQLEDFIEMEKIRGSDNVPALLVERYSRDAIPVSILILTIIGAVIASRKVRGGSGAHLGIGVLLSVTYILFSRLAVVFATKGSFTPWIAAWTPNFIFGALAYYLYRQAQQ